MKYQQILAAYARCAWTMLAVLSRSMQSTHDRHVTGRQAGSRQAGRKARRQTDSGTLIVTNMMHSKPIKGQTEQGRGKTCHAGGCWKSSPVGDDDCTLFICCVVACMTCIGGSHWVVASELAIEIVCSHFDLDTNPRTRASGAVCTTTLVHARWLMSVACRAGLSGRWGPHASLPKRPWAMGHGWHPAVHDANSCAAQHVQ